jgi:uncharacterized protein YerC
MDIESNIVILDPEDLQSLEAVYSVYTKEQKIEAVSMFCKGHTFSEISRTLGIPVTTMMNWRERSNWWNGIVLKNKQDSQVELDNRLTSTIHKALDELADRLSNGDQKPDRQGSLQYVPLSARDLATVLSTLYEKRALIRGEATSIKTESKNSLLALEDKFKSFAIQLKEKDVISDQGN